MAQKHTTGSFAKRKRNQKPKPGLTAQVILYFGLFLLIFSLLYMALNLDKADTILSTWLLFFIAGLALMAVSRFFK